MFHDCYTISSGLRCALWREVCIHCRCNGDTRHAARSGRIGTRVRWRRSVFLRRRKKREGKSRAPAQARLRSRQWSRHPRRLHKQVIEAALAAKPILKTKELIAGYWLWRVKSMQQAMEWGKRCSMKKVGISVIEGRDALPALLFDAAGSMPIQ